MVTTYYLKRTRSYNYSRSSSSSYKPRSIRQKERKDRGNIIRNITLVILLLIASFVWGIPALTGALSVFNHHSGTQATHAADVVLAPPVLNIPYEATNSASIQINGYANPSLKVEVFLEDELKSTVTADPNGKFQTGFINLSLGTNNIYGKTVDSSGKESLASKTIQLTYNNDKPKLETSSPADNSQIKGGDKKVTVSGSTDSGDNVTVNGITVIVDSDGNFSTILPINDGDNTITIISTNEVGNTSQQTLKVNYASS